MAHNAARANVVVNSSPAIAERDISRQLSTPRRQWRPAALWRQKLPQPFFDAHWPMLPVMLRELVRAIGAKRASAAWEAFILPMTTRAAPGFYVS